MQCEKCRAEIEPGSTVCPECGAPQPQNVQGFDNTKQIQIQLKLMIDQQGESILTDTTKFIGLINDYIAEYDKERRLLINMHKADVIANMLTEPNHEIGISKMRSFMSSELFLADNAVEFVICCFTYMLGWEYESPLREPDEEELDADEPEEFEEPPASVEDKVFLPLDAGRYRIARNIRIPNGVTKIDNFCFDGFNFMRTIVLPQTLLAIGDYAFSECKSLKGVDLPPSVRIIKQGAFSQCAKLAVIKLPDGILEIEDNTFSFCANLEVVDIPPTVSSIGAAAFSGCEKLRKLFLPESIKFIDETAFTYCPQLVIHCYENSYVHKFCTAHNIRVETVAKGEGLK